MSQTNRRIVREQVKASLLHCVVFAGANVFTSRARKLDSYELPAILIYTPLERVSVYNASPLEYKRVCTVKVEVLAEGDDDIEDLLDDYAMLIEKALELHDTLNGAVDGILLISKESEISAEAERITGGIALTYEATYYTEAANNGDDERHDPLVPFVTAATTFKHAGSLADSPATNDQVTFEEEEE